MDLQTEIECTPERWAIEKRTDEHLFIVDVQEVTIATVWKQPHDTDTWVYGNACLMAASSEMWEVIKLLPALADAAKILEKSYAPSVSNGLIDVINAANTIIADVKEEFSRIVPES